MLIVSVPRHMYRLYYESMPFTRYDRRRIINKPLRTATLMTDWVPNIHENHLLYERNSVGQLGRNYTAKIIYYGIQHVS